MARLGLHVTVGPRNGYGEVVGQRPSLVVSTEGGALLEAKQESGGHTWSIYREMEFYGDNPGGVLESEECTQEQAYEVADWYYPLFRDKWAINPADYYIVINESGANNPRIVQNYVWYEWRMMELAEVDGYRLCLGNLFSGTPDDGSVAGGEPDGGIETWKELYGPLLRRAAEGGHIYGRHVYGFPHLSPLTPNTDRAFREARWLYEEGIYVGVAITECGLDGGQGPIGGHELISQADAFSSLILGSEILSRMIIGFAWWTYGDFKGANGQANIQVHSPQIAAYLADNPSERWEPIDYLPPTQREPRTLKHTVHILPQDTTKREYEAVTSHLFDTKTAFTFSHDVVEALMFWSTEDGDIVAWEPWRWNFDLEAYLSWLGVDWIERSFDELGEIPPDFHYEVWPVRNEPRVTQEWAAWPEYYGQFCEEATGLCLPGHGGVDMRAAGGTIVQAVAPGVCVRAWRLDVNGHHNFGNHVYLEHEDGELTGYCHLSKLEIEFGETAAAGEMIGLSGNSGNSFGPHLHFLRKRPGETYTDEHGSWPWSMHDPTEFLKEVAPEAFEPEQPPAEKHNVHWAMTVDTPRGVLYEVRTEYLVENEWRPGPQERHQTHMEDGSFYHTKGGDGPHKDAQWEHLMADGQYIYRDRDTSMGDGKFYDLQDVLGVPWSAWCPRMMAVGEEYARNPHVFVYDKDSCENVSNARQPSSIRLEAVHEEFEFFTGITLQGVFELVWTIDGQEIERYFYAEEYGLVGWGYGTTGRRAAVSEIHEPGSRPDNIRETIHCP
jgi:hypothetical protein